MAKLRELLANYAHNAWSGWMKYMFSKGTINIDGTLTIPRELAERWARQMSIPYEYLSITEQQSDLIEADAIIDVIRQVNIE